VITALNNFLAWCFSGDARNSRDPLKYEGRDWRTS
jgi:hypothetical protein